MGFIKQQTSLGGPTLIGNLDVFVVSLWCFGVSMSQWCLSVSCRVSASLRGLRGACFLGWSQHASSNCNGSNLLSCWQSWLVMMSLSILFRWWLVSWWHFGGVSIVSWRCPVMFWVFPWCLGSVPVVSWWYWRNGIFLTKLAHLSTQKLASKETRNFAKMGLYAGLISPRMGLLWWEYRAHYTMG